MSELIEAIVRTRKTAADIAAKALVDIEGKSEVEIRDRILAGMKEHPEIYPTGWYDPPAGGVGVLFSEKPFKRLQFDTLRSSEYWPNGSSSFKKESVGIIHLSPFERATSMMGDIGFTVYNGESAEIKNHIRTCYNAILQVAEYSETGMKFSELCDFAKKLFNTKFKVTKWITTFLFPLGDQEINLGHTVPGSFEENFYFGEKLNEIIETIRTKRVFINSGEQFIIPETCAFTMEARLADEKNEDLPNAYFHFIVTFDKGKKKILENFNEIFSAVGMDYMNTK